MSARSAIRSSQVSSAFSIARVVLSASASALTSKKKTNSYQERTGRLAWTDDTGRLLVSLSSLACCTGGCMDASTRVQTILFLISDTGAGHRSAANAIRNAMNLLAPEVSDQETRGLPVPGANESQPLKEKHTFAPSPSSYCPAYQVKVVD